MTEEGPPPRDSGSGSRPALLELQGVFSLEHWKTPTDPLTPAKTPTPLAGAFCHPHPSCTVVEAWGPGWSFISFHSVPCHGQHAHGIWSGFRPFGLTLPPNQLWPPMSPRLGQQGLVPACSGTGPFPGGIPPCSAGPRPESGALFGSRPPAPLHCPKSGVEKLMQT